MNSERFQVRRYSSTTSHLILLNNNQGLERVIHDSFWIICITKSYEEVRLIQEEVGRRLKVAVLAGNLKAIKMFHEITKDEIRISLLS